MFDPTHPIVTEDIEKILAEALPWEALAGQHVLVTGATGMLGGYLTLCLLRLGRMRLNGLRISLLVRDAARAQARFGDLLSGAGVDVVSGSLQSPPQLPAGMPDLIIHAASPASPRDYATHPVDVIRANAAGTMALLDAYARGGDSRFLFLGSAVYGSTENLGPVDEDSFGAVPTLDARNCYIESKRMAETLLESWRCQYGLDYRIGRIFHTFGPGLNLDDGRIFSDVLRAALARQPIVLTSDGLARRAFCYLADTVSAFFHLLLAGRPGLACNIGNPDNELTIREFASLASRLTDPPLPLHFAAPDLSAYTPARTSRGQPDITRIRALGWRPAVTAADALARTYRSFLP
ncbi:MAG: NAD-dependent epimerase/dehydratase family protein [Rhodocyclaceae bacterium]|nr:NAD-dependent epimerase/dehydratase family protein [Rhodocyclaceae bacterium]